MTFPSPLQIALSLAFCMLPTLVSAETSSEVSDTLAFIELAKAIEATESEPGTPSAFAVAMLRQVLSKSTDQESTARLSGLAIQISENRRSASQAVRDARTSILCDPSGYPVDYESILDRY
ncbi:MAG: hypothetical protein AAGJ55_10725, partial [Cyanobacteria bacterium J06555_12]